MIVFCCWILSDTDHSLPIHREAPAFVEQATEQQILVTGIKVYVFDIPPLFLLSFVESDTVRK